MIALLNPVLPLAEYMAMRESLDIILVLDLSSSMSEPIDRGKARFRPWTEAGRQEKTRLDAVKEAMVDFIAEKMGMLVGCDEDLLTLKLQCFSSWHQSSRRRQLFDFDFVGVVA